MCLAYSQTASDKLREKLASGPVKFYKLYRVEMAGGEKVLLSPHQLCQTAVINGFINSNRSWGSALTEREQNTREVIFGIHVYTTPPLDKTSSCVGFLEVTGVAEDFVGASALWCGQQEAVFVKVSVDPETLSVFLKNTSVEDDDEDYDDDDDDDEDDDECPDCGDPYCNGECLDDDEDDDYEEDEEEEEEDWDDDDDDDD